MKDKCILSIVILTMNRKQQLIEALESCMRSTIPEDTEFVIVDNASTDGTDEEVKRFFERHTNYSYLYEYEQENLGVGGGRARAFDIASGEYLYFLDDDAVIAEESKERFFTDAIVFFEKHANVASITTKIIDTVFTGNRNDNLSRETLEGKPLVFSYLGGSHFLRKTVFDAPLYFSVLYGSEEYAPCISTQDKGYVHVYFEDIYIIHKPKVNKWIDGSVNMEKVLYSDIAIKYATKVILYPVVFRPILALAYRRRCKKYLAAYSGGIKKCNELVKQTIKENKRPKIRCKTVIRMYKNFGLTVF